MLTTPLDIQVQIKRSDLVWLFVYYFRERFFIKALISIFCASALLYYVISDFGHEMGGLRYAYMSISIFLGITLVDAAVYFFPIMLFPSRHTKQLLRNPTALVFSSDGIASKSFLSEGTLKYESFRKIKIHKRHILFKFPGLMTLIVPWRHVPQDRCMDFRAHLQTIDLKADAQ